MNIAIIGLGGVGSALLDPICRFLQYSEKIHAGDPKITLIDGDSYEEKNRTRQLFLQLGNKAQTKRNECKRRFQDITFDVIEEYVYAENVMEIIKEGTIVFLCVDNHKTRKVVSDHARKLKDVVIISGGNEYIDGNVQIYMKEGGEEITPSLTDYHPEIRNPGDKSPEEMSCEELSKSEPQLLFTNLTVATIMCWVFYAAIVLRNVPANFAEVYFDIENMNVKPTLRKPIKL